MIHHDALVHEHTRLDLQDFLEGLRHRGGDIAGLRGDLRRDFLAAPKRERAKQNHRYDRAEKGRRETEATTIPGGNFLGRAGIGHSLP